MAKTKRDLSIKKNADISRNKTALICMTITTVLLAAAYFIEVLKDARTIGDYAILAATCLVPPVIGWIMYKIKKDNAIIRYVVTGEEEQEEGCTGSCSSCSGCH